jgi:hypothetical protein
MTPQVPPRDPSVPGAYAVTNTDGLALYHVSGSSGLGVHHFAALEALFQHTDRFDRLHLHMEQMFFHYLAEAGAWGHESSDLQDVAALFRFLSACYRQPTPTELQQFLRPS